MAKASAVITTVSPIMVMMVMISSACASRISLLIDTSMFDTALPEAARGEIEKGDEPGEDHGREQHDQHRARIVRRHRPGEALP